MHLLTPFTSGLLLLAGTTLSMGQVAPAPPEATPTPALAASAEAPTQRVLLKVGFNAGRAFRNGGYLGVSSRLPVAVGAEYLLNPKWSLYGQLDTDFNFFTRNNYFGQRRSPLVPSGALGLGVRYYGSRTRGPLEGPYVGAEAHTEVNRFYYDSNRVLPALNLICGTQRRLGNSFLIDLNAGVGIGANRLASDYRGYNPSPLTVTTQLNLNIYYCR